MQHSNNGLLCDIYAITMAHDYWRLGMSERQAEFQLIFRKHPFNGHYTLFGGLELMIDHIQNWQFPREAIDFLSTLTFPNKQARFQPEFLEYLGGLSFSGHVSALTEGTLIYPGEPLLQVRGSVIECQLLETALINLANLSTLVATKAARICQAAGSDAISEFGLRRAQSPESGVIASRAAYIGGVSSTSNALAGQRYQIPTLGTIAHSWILAFANEGAAFTAAAECMHEATVLLVDTFDTKNGIALAIETAKTMHQKGHSLYAIRLDSGDLAALSYYAREQLDAAGLKKTKIIVSGNLDEYAIKALKDKKAPIDLWGVGTRLATSFDQPALDLAYKMTGIEDEHGQWQYRCKRSDTPAKSTLPGHLQIRRYYQQDKPIADLIFEATLGIKHDSPPWQADRSEDLLKPILKTVN